MRTLFLTLVAGALIPAAFADSSFSVHCTPSGGSATIGNSLFFDNATGNGLFACSDASLNLATLSAVTVEIFTDYTAGDGTGSTPDNSAGFTFSNTDTTWDAATSSDGSPKVTSMTLDTSNVFVTVFVIGNLSSSGDTFTGTTSGGLGGTLYAEPMLEDITGTLLDTFSIAASGFLDAGGFSGGDSDAHIDAIFTGTQNTTPEPMSLLLTGAGLLGVGFLARRKRAQ